MEKVYRRLDYMDNLRSLVIILVVLQHLAVTYSSLGSWYYMDGVPLSLAETAVFGYYQSFVQGFFMGFLFLLSGYFVRASYNKKGFMGFVCERLKRLGIPALIYMLVINPFILYVQLDLSWVRPKPSFFSFYLDHLANFDFLSGSGPLWFAIALLVFSVIYALVRLIKGPGKKAAELKRPLYSSKNVVFLIFIIALLAFLTRTVQPVGTSVMNMQLCYFAQYICLFAVGIVLGKHKGFDTIGYRSGIRWLLSATPPAFLCWAVIMLFGGALEGDLSYNGGFTWQSAAFALWESFIAVAVSVGLVVLFREKLNRKNKLAAVLADNSFAVYMFHAPVIIAAAQLAAPLTLPPIVKFLLLAVICVPLCFAVCQLIIRKIPLLNKVL